MTRRKKAGIGTLCVGVFDWYCRFDAGKALVTKATNAQFAAFVAQWWVAPLILIIALVLLYLDRHDEESPNQTLPPSPVKAEASVKDSGNATATGGSVNLHLEYPPISAAPPPPPKAKDEPTPIIDFARYENAMIDGENTALRREDIGSHLLTAVFHNPRWGVGQKTPRADRVHAQLTYRPDGKDEVNVHYGSWLGAYTHFVEFGAGTYQYLVVALSSKDGSLYTLENYNSFDPRTRRIRSGGIVLRGPKSIPLIQNVSSVEIALLQGEMTLFEREFELVKEADGTMRLV
jgi:hypothetical protein